MVTGIQYWTPDYLKNVIGVDDNTVSIYFSTSSLSAPVSGVIIGGIITSAYGGYNTKKGQKLQSIVGCCAVLCALPIPWLSKFYYVGILFWLLLFFGGFILPPVTGIMINSVNDLQKSSANSIANLCYNLFGYLPAPSVYGMISSVTGGSKSRWSMACLLYSTIISISFLMWAINTKLEMEENKGEGKKNISLYNNKQSTSYIGSNDKKGDAGSDEVMKSLIHKDLSAEAESPNQIIEEEDQEKESKGKFRGLNNNSSEIESSSPYLSPQATNEGLQSGTYTYNEPDKEATTQLARFSS